MLKVNCWPTVVFMLIGSSGVSLPGEVEKWSDKNLPVHDGLLFWLDAASQPTAWQAHGRPGLYTQAPFDVWYDASGNGLDLMQRIKDAQPHFVQAGERAAVRFDGKDDFLELAQP